MNAGMMGALGGLGGGMVNQAALMQKEDDANAEMGRKKSYEQWLMQARDEYAIKTEARADAREVAKDERNWKNKQERAPVERGIKTADKVAEKKGELDFESENIDTISGNKKKITEAGRTDAQKREDNARADLYEANAKSVKDETGKNARASKLPAHIKEQVDALDKEIGDTQKKIDEAKLNKTWDASPEQKAIEARVASQRLQRAALLRQTEGGPKNEGSAAPDPQNLRGGGASSKPTGMMGATGPTNAAERGMKNDISGPMGADPIAIDREIASTKADLAKVKNPADRANLQAYLDDLNRQKEALNDTGTPPLARMTQRPTITAGSKPLPRSLADVPGSRVDLPVTSGVQAVGGYEQAVNNLRERVKQQGGL